MHLCIKICVVKHIFQYIKGSLFHDFTFHRDSSLYLIVYSIVDWATDVFTCHSVTCGYVFLRRNLVCWTINKQAIVSRSSAESEYHTLTYVIDDVWWFCYLLRELGILLYSSSLLLCDNQSILHMTTNPVFHART